MNIPLWINEPKILLTNLNHFFIDKTLSDNENKNAIARFGIYLGLLIFIFNQDNQWLLLSLIIILFSLIYNSKINELFTTNQPNNSQCQEPTTNNPFMNYTIGDLIDNPDKKPACLYSDENIKNKVKNEYNKNIYIDKHDIWGKDTSDRHFFTMPNTGIVNNQTEFAKWCFGNSGLCKTTGQGCLKNIDPVYSFSKGVMVDYNENNIDPYNSV